MKRQQRAFSLIEVLVVGLVSSVISAGAYSLLTSAYTSQQTVIGQNASILNARAAIDDAMDRVRGAQVNGATGPVTLASASEVRFLDYYDQYVSGQAHTLVTIRYSVSSGRLQRSILDGGGSTLSFATVASGVQSVQFYYRLTGSTTWSTSTNAPASVAAVSCTANVAVSGTSRQITGTVQIRQKGAG